jgi:ABC-2 type transport system ATP-binding protein
MSAIVETHGLVKRYDRTLAVAGIDLAVEPGEIFGLVGPNGAGKTTTLRMLATLLRPSAGQAEIDGWSVTRNPDEVRRVIGFMPDVFGVYDDMKVWEYIDFFARCYGLPAAGRRRMIADLLELVDLADRRDDYVQTLSRGMEQRLCLAQVLVHDPKVLLLDEPASGLDPRARVELRELLRELRSLGKTILISSHILPELEELCTSVAISIRPVLASGRVGASPIASALAACTTPRRSGRRREVGRAEEVAGRGRRVGRASPGRPARAQRAATRPRPRRAQCHPIRGGLSSFAPLAAISSFLRCRLRERRARGGQA